MTLGNQLGDLRPRSHRLDEYDLIGIHVHAIRTMQLLAALHNSDYIRSALTSTLTQDAGLSIDFTDEEKLLDYDRLRHYKILIMFRDGLRFPNGYWHQAYWNEKKNNVVSVPPIQKKIGHGRVGRMTAEQGKGIKQWVDEGGLLWAFHNNSQASQMNKDYREVEGAIYTGHPPFQSEDPQSRSSYNEGRQRFRSDRRTALRHL